MVYEKVTGGYEQSLNTGHLLGLRLSPTYAMTPVELADEFDKKPPLVYIL